MKYYLHRISHHMEWSYPLLEEKNLLSIGWSRFGALPKFVSDHQDNWSSVADTVESHCGKDRGRFGLKRFLEMEQGDRVIVPTWGEFHVYEVANNERLVPAQVESELKDLKNWHGKDAVIRERLMWEQNADECAEIDIGFFRRVKSVQLNIPRDGYADAALTSRMKVRQTNVEITDLSDSIENAISRHRKLRPIDLRRNVLEKCFPMVCSTILEDQTPDQFERLIERWFECQGANTYIPPKNKRDKEGDADIIATFESLKLIVYVQAKHHKGETDDWAVHQVKQYADDKGVNGSDEEFMRTAWVISTAEKFSDPCQKLARLGRVRLINGNEFACMLLDTGIGRFQEP